VSNDPHRPSSDPTAGESRRGRREQDRSRERISPAMSRGPVLGRHRSLVLGLVAVAAVAVVGGFVFVQATTRAYACSDLTAPAPAATPLANGSPAPIGQVQPDMGRNHVADGTFVRFSHCPPASGNHYSSTLGPIEPRYYGPDDETVPQGWLHNLEHGGIVILYSCTNGGCGDADQQALKNLFQTFPDSPLCAIPKGTIGPVITRFEEMKSRFAALVWGRVVFLDTLDTARILDFFRTQGELHNPEPQCQRPTPAPATTTAPSAAPSAAPSVAPSPSPS
jgi:hypothetical protein